MAKDKLGFIGRNYAFEKANEILAELNRYNSTIGFEFQVSAPCYYSVNDGRLVVYPDSDFENEEKPITVCFLGGKEMYIAFSPTKEEKSPSGLRTNKTRQITGFIRTVMWRTFQEEEDE